MGQGGLGPRDYVAIALRRKWHFLLPAALLMVLALAAAITWPPTFQSEATILVEQAEVPEDLVATVVTDYVERRLEAITQRVLVTDNLQRLIERYNLYPKRRAEQPLSKVVEAMRGNIGMEIVSANVVNPRSGQKSTSTVAFKLAFDYSDSADTPQRVAETAQKVTNELVTLYLNENLRQRRERAAESANFLGEERGRLDQRITEVQNQFEAFRQQHAGSLPDQLNFNQQALTRYELSAQELDRRLLGLREREAFLSAQLALTEPTQLYGGGQGRPQSPLAQLEVMRLELTTASGRYGPDHPDVRRLRREVAALEESVGGDGGRTQALQRDRDTAKAELDQLRNRYTPEHPDVRRAQRQLEQAEASLRQAQSSSGPGGGAARPDNPAYIQLQSQLNSAQTELKATLEQRGSITQRQGELEKLLLAGTQVVREYGNFESQLKQLEAQRQELLTKEAAARLGQALESESKGESFSLIEPPSFPVDPIKPNKLLIVALGMVLAAGGGAGVVAVTQIFDDAIYSAKDVTAILGEPPLALVPRIVTRRDRTRRWLRRLATLLVVLALATAALWAIDSFVIPLDILSTVLGQTVDRLLGGSASVPAPIPAR